MNLWLRLLWVLLRYRRESAELLLGELRMTFHVMPHDLDLLLHMNNARYLAWMDLGRLALMRRTGAFDELRRRGAVGLLGGVVVYYIRPLSLFQRVELSTRVVAWDDKWIYLEHRFERGETLHARALARVLARDADGNVPTARVLGLLGVPNLEPPGPPPAEFRAGRIPL